MPMDSVMYTVIGVYPNGREAILEYQTLDEALQKIRDLVEADEMEASSGNEQEVMFMRYALEVPAIMPPPVAPPGPGRAEIPREPPASMRLRLVDEYEDEDEDDRA